MHASLGSAEGKENKAYMAMGEEAVAKERNGKTFITGLHLPPFLSAYQSMARATNWLSFSLSPMEMLRTSEPQFVQYDAASATNSHHYFLDNLYANNGNIYSSHLVVLTCLPLPAYWFGKNKRT
ncbi:unnamed protein product [Sphenostylis stenocarpa]|uniref:Uncharacterized protein n=1 Tax=Sphenostylis stenocarpa TaxID=92480 RepID=A0AA86RXQ9_9FABA|nr:unnamed protein product [Sphenostylis stenocarpa]